MIHSLYEPFKHWSDGGSVYILSDLHFDDVDCKLMCPSWITSQEQVDIINRKVHANDTFVCLGDVGNPQYIPLIKAKKKILILGNHDKPALYNHLFTEVYSGALFISSKILLSHEPVYGLSFCFNIHGHDHNEQNKGDTHHLNLAANVCGWTPVSLGDLIKKGIVSNIDSIHREAIEKQKEKKLGRIV